MKPLLAALLLLPGAAPGHAWADTHTVTIRNGTAETIRAITFGDGESRLRRELPPGAEARITYSTSCRTDIRIAYASGRTEDHAGVEACSDPRITAGQDGVAGPPQDAPAATPKAAPGPKVAAASPAVTPVKAQPPLVPPWTGKSITKRFGGLD